VFIDWCHPSFVNPEHCFADNVRDRHNFKEVACALFVALASANIAQHRSSIAQSDAMLCKQGHDCINRTNASLPCITGTPCTLISCTFLGNLISAVGTNAALS
jgi:hypothetical protein